MRISLARFNNSGASAGLDDPDGIPYAIAEGNSYSAKRACKVAAERLRKAADRFEALALLDHPFNEGTQDNVNSK